MVFKGNPTELQKINVSFIQQQYPILTDDNIYNNINCDWITKELNRHYYVAKHEREFPLAFSLNVYNSPYQILRFLKVIYRPHNVYCIHYDQKSSDYFKKLIIYISACLPNIIVPRKIENVVRSWHTVVDAQMNCMEDLYKLRHKFPWKYVITLCGKEVPLRTNREMVDTLQKLNGTSAVRLSHNLPHEYRYWKFKHSLKENKVVKQNQSLAPPPFNLIIAKSLAYFGLSQVFVRFILYNETAIKIRKFMDETKIPEEHYIATLFNMEGNIFIV